MTRKHYIKVAEALADANFRASTVSEEHLVEEMIDAMCEVFDEENPNFDEQRFREACLPRRKAT